MITALAAAAPPTRDSNVPPSPETIMASTFALLVVVGYWATTPAGLHWFVLPVAACAVLIGGDAVRWIRGSTDVFDPAGIIGLLGLYLFFVAPLLHVRWDYWMRYVQPPPDWRDWLGAMAVLNCAGLLAYRGTRAAVARAPWTFRRMRVLDPKRVSIVLPLAMVTAVAAQYWVYGRYGGLLGFVNAFERQDNSFAGMGVVFLVSESLPILAFMGFAILSDRYPSLKSWWMLALALVLFFGLKIGFGGLRGSRSHTVWGIFWALGITHLWIRPLPRRLVLAGVPVLTAFMFGYGLYKAAGIEGLEALTEPERAAAIAERSGRTFHSTLLGDLGRSDVQAYVLYRVQTDAARDLAWGRSYLGGVAILIPRALYPNRPPTKVKDGTDVLYGRATYDTGRISLRVYGLAGEAMLNGGVWAVPVMFALWGVLVGALRAAYHGLASKDARLLMLPLLILLCVISLIGDSDNVVMFLFKEGTFPLAVLLVCSRLTRRDDPRPSSEVSAWT